MKKTLAFSLALAALACVSVAFAQWTFADEPTDSRTWTPRDTGEDPTPPPWEGCPSDGWVPNVPVFAVPMNYWVGPYRIDINVMNLTGRPIGCQTYMRGWTARGLFLHGVYVLPPLFPGQQGFAYMTTTWVGDRFVNGGAWAWCQQL